MKKVLLIFGGNSTEHNISIKSAQSIFDNINLFLFDVTPVFINKQNEWFVTNNTNLNDRNNDIKIDNIIEFLKGYDVVFPITHGNNGEDGKLEGLFDLFNIKYVGSKTDASVLCFDKELAKIFFKHLNINQVPFITIKNMKEIKKIKKFPVIIKPANGGSSIGINKANNKKELKKAVKEAFKYDKKIIIEKFINTRELEVAVLKKKNKLIISDIGEIVSCNNFYDYEAKYQKESKLQIPANINKEIKNEIKKIAKLLFIEMNLKNYARIDFFLENNSLYINEINTIPGFTEISMFPKLIENNKITYQDLITILINNA